MFRAILFGICLLLLTGCMVINRPLRPDEVPVPVYDFRGGNFFEVYVERLNIV